MQKRFYDHRSYLSENPLGNQYLLEAVAPSHWRVSLRALFYDQHTCIFEHFRTNAWS